MNTRDYLFHEIPKRFGGQFLWRQEKNELVPLLDDEFIAQLENGISSFEKGLVNTLGSTYLENGADFYILYHALNILEHTPKGYLNPQNFYQNLFAAVNLSIKLVYEYEFGSNPLAQMLKIEPSKLALYEKNLLSAIKYKTPLPPTTESYRYSFSLISIEKELMDYQEHLYQKLYEFAKEELPEEIFEAYHDKNGDFLIDNLVKNLSTGRSVLWATPACKDENFAANLQLEKEAYKKIYAYGSKIKLVNQFLNTLKDVHMVPEERINAFKKGFFKPENQDILLKHTDSFSMQLLKNIGFSLLTVFFGVGLVVSYKTKGTPFFWKSHGEVAVEKLKKLDIVESPKFSSGKSGK